MKSAEFVARHTVQGLKIHALHLIQNTALARMYAKEPFSLMNESEYVNLVVDILEILSPEVTIHRLTGDGPRSLLIGPEWTLRKHHVLNSIDTCLKKRNTWQGRLYKA
jgi:radical SAM superfamily enzyme